MLYVSHREPLTKVLGPGQRYALWLQGCEKRCPNCIFPSGQSLDGGGQWHSVEKIWSEIKAVPNLTGITISGGEPFLQAAAVAKLIKILRGESTLDVMIFTGYTLAELQDKHDAATDFILKNIDLLVDGEYREELNTNSLYRGSDNQVLHYLSPKYLPFKDLIARTKSRCLEFVYRKDSEFFMVGIPPKNFEEIFLSKLLKE